MHNRRRWKRWIGLGVLGGLLAAQSGCCSEGGDFLTGALVGAAFVAGAALDGHCHSGGWHHCH